MMAFCNKFSLKVRTSTDHTLLGKTLPLVCSLEAPEESHHWRKKKSDRHIPFDTHTHLPTHP